jgi:pentatricopeptide repeat protein
MKVRYSKISLSTTAMRDSGPGHRGSAKPVIRKKDVVPFNQRIATAAKDKNLSFALSQWDSIQKEQIEPSAHTFSAMVNAFVRCGQLSKAEEFVKLMEKAVPLDDKSREGCLITLTTLLKGYLMSSAHSRSHALFDRIIRVAAPGKVGSRTLDTYLRGCLKTGAFEEAINAFSSPNTEKSEMSKVYVGKMHAIRLHPKSAADVGGTSDPSLCLHIATAYIRLGKMDRAQAWLNCTRELLYTSAPDRQFDKLQKSELLRLVDFYGAETNHGAVSLATSAAMTRQFLTLHGRTHSVWEQLGLGKLDSSDEGGPILASFHAALETAPHVVLEVCSGSGEWICREAEKNREKLYIAVEFRFDRCVDILIRKTFIGLDNLFIVSGDARRILELIPEHSVDTVHINYPEPPPANSSFIEEEMSSDIVTKKFLREVVVAACKPNVGQLHIVSDDKQYMQSVGYLVGDVFGTEVFPKSSKTLVDSYFARFFSRKAKRYDIIVPVK